jgi:hypothetical protein
MGDVDSDGCVVLEELELHSVDGKVQLMVPPSGAVSISSNSPAPPLVELKSAEPTKTEENEALARGDVVATRDDSEHRDEEKVPGEEAQEEEGDILDTASVAGGVSVHESPPVQPPTPVPSPPPSPEKVEDIVVGGECHSACESIASIFL